MSEYIIKKPKSYGNFKISKKTIKKLHNRCTKRLAYETTSKESLIRTTFKLTVKISDVFGSR